MTDKLFERKQCKSFRPLQLALSELRLPLVSPAMTRIVNKIGTYA